jgi:hypothetical protein
MFRPALCRRRNGAIKSLPSIGAQFHLFRGPRIIATDRQAPRIYPRMIRLCSRFDSVLFTPKISEIPSYGNYSRSPLVGLDFAMPGSFLVQHNDFARYDIPAPLAREIGRFIVTWAHFEDYVQSIIWGTLQLSHKEGRIAVRQSRITERLDIIRDLGVVQNLAVDFILLSEIRKRADVLAGNRHLVAHSIWQKPSAYWVVIKTRGSWSEDQREIAEHLRGSKSIEPEAISITAGDVRRWTEETIVLMDDVMRLGDQHRPVPLPEKRKPRSVPKNRKADRKGSGRKPPHPTSRE